MAAGAPYGSSSPPTAVRRLTVPALHAMAREGTKIAMLTCYDASFAGVCERAGADVLLVGDSLGMVIQGHATTLPVTLDDAIYHTRAVARGCGRPLIIADLPFGSYQGSPQDAYAASVRALQAGAQMVKVEGGDWLAPTVQFLVERGVPVCGHVGLQPQSVNTLGGFRVQAKDAATQGRLQVDALALQEAGAAIVVLECVPRAAAAALCQLLRIPVIGIGAGPDCAGQVLVLYDVLGIQPTPPARFVRNFMQGSDGIEAAVRAYVAAVKDGSFPAAEHCF
jgi:3-methyl-2-oxobutanoate hydroxymethyltransferase